MGKNGVPEQDNGKKMKQTLQLKRQPQETPQSSRKNCVCESEGPGQSRRGCGRVFEEEKKGKVPKSVQEEKAAVCRGQG